MVSVRDISRHRKQLRDLLLVDPNAPIPRHQRDLRLPVVSRIKDYLAIFFRHNSLLVCRGLGPFDPIRLRGRKHFFQFTLR